MPNRSRSRVVVAGRSRRETLWFGGPDETVWTGVAAGAVDFQSSLNVASLALRPFTIVRVRGLLMLRSDQIAAIEEPFGAFGLAVVSDQAVAAGVASLPSPITDQASDLWFSYTFCAATWQFNTSGAASPTPFEIDSKAMRKVEDGMNIVSMFENGSGGSGCNYIAIWRMLIKLH